MSGLIFLVKDSSSDPFLLVRPTLSSGSANVSFGRARRRTQLVFGNGPVCADHDQDVDGATGFTINGQDASCALLKLHCKDSQLGCQISYTCPVTCVACDTCDLPETGLSFSDGEL